ncbi:conserved hypothetical protein [Ricinus communis]|uniref:Uncharacterized protein n=1 Tax=Ricinus communis TaxID=3988 RepID=B9SBD6_RICCO|nr:conserved hypothetical protein [Ricinus communis]
MGQKSLRLRMHKEVPMTIVASLWKTEMPVIYIALQTDLQPKERQDQVIQYKGSAIALVMDLLNHIILHFLRHVRTKEIDCLLAT